MPSLLARFALALACLCTLPAQAIDPMPADTVVLPDHASSFSLDSNIQVWLDPHAKADIAQASASPQHFTTVAALHRQALTEDDALWVKLRLARPVGSTQRWTLNIPLPFLDAATLYQRDAAGQWTAQTAGDSLAQSDWNKRGLYPEFDLTLPVGTSQEVYLQVHNFKHLSLPLRLATTAQRETQRLLEMAALGLVLGILLALCVLSLVRYLEHRSRFDAWASAFGLLILLTVAQINGVLNMVLWPALPWWGNYANSVLPVVAVGAALLFVHNLYVLSTHFRRYDVYLRSIGWGTILSALSFAIMERATADAVTASIMVLATTVGMVATLLSWRGKSSIWPWLMLAYLPQYLGLMRLMAEALGLVPTLWEMRYLTSLGIALSAPVLVYALSRATHDRKELNLRANLLPTQDALTGLLTPQAFHIQLENAYERAVSQREPIALVLVKVANHEYLRQTLGDTVAEQCLLRAVVKLHRMLRDVDPAGRVRTAHFALLLEGVAHRKALTERMVQLVASGLIPLPGLTPPVHLQFQVACVLLHENPVAPEGALAQLDTLLESMSPHTRRPVRFLEPVSTQPGALPDQSTVT